jgi:hypothetical protein
MSFMRVPLPAVQHGGAHLQQQRLQRGAVGLVGAEHEQRFAPVGMRGQAPHGRVGEAHALLLCRGGQRIHRVGVDGAEFDQVAVLAQAREHAAFAQDHLARLLGAGQHGEHHVHAGGERLHAGRARRAQGHELVHGRALDVVHCQCHAVAQQVGGQGEAHAAQADESGFHAFPWLV